MTDKTINGTSGNDTIAVDSQYTYTVSAGAGTILYKRTIQPM